MRIDINGVIVSDDDAWIYDWFGIEHTNPKAVKSKIQGTQNKELVDVFINSGGGDVFAGSEIYSELRNYGNVKIHITGCAASAASVIACAGESEISPTAMFMIHNVSCSASGDYNAFNKMSDTLQKVNKSVAGAYVTKSGMTEEEALKMMNDETWLTAQDAVNRRLVDKISEPSARFTNSAFGMMLSAETIKKIRNIIPEPNTENKAKALSKLNYLKLKGGF